MEPVVKGVEKVTQAKKKQEATLEKARGGVVGLTVRKEDTQQAKQNPPCNECKTRASDRNLQIKARAPKDLPRRRPRRQMEMKRRQQRRQR